MQVQTALQSFPSAAGSPKMGYRKSKTVLLITAYSAGLFFLLNTALLFCYFHLKQCLVPSETTLMRVAINA